MDFVSGESDNPEVNLCLEKKGWYLEGGPVCENTLMWNRPICIQWRKNTANLMLSLGVSIRYYNFRLFLLNKRAVKIDRTFYINVELNSVIWCHLVLRLIVCNRGFLYQQECC